MTSISSTVASPTLALPLVREQSYFPPKCAGIGGEQRLKIQVQEVSRDRLAKFLR